MNIAQASRAWELSEKEVQIICKEMGLDAGNIPEETVPVYVPHRFYKYNSHRYYIYLLDVISNTHMELKGIDPANLEICVAQLKEKKLIVLKPISLQSSKKRWIVTRLSLMSTLSS